MLFTALLYSIVFKHCIFLIYFLLNIYAIFYTYILHIVLLSKWFCMCPCTTMICTLLGNDHFSPEAKLCSEVLSLIRQVVCQLCCPVLWREPRDQRWRVQCQGPHDSHVVALQSLALIGSRAGSSRSSWSGMGFQQALTSPGCNSMCWKLKIRHLRWWWGWELLTVPGLLKYFTGKAVSSMCFSSTCFQMPNYIWTPFLHISSKEKSHSSLNTLLLRNLFLKFSGFITQILLWIALCPPVRA